MPDLYYLCDFAKAVMPSVSVSESVSDQKQIHRGYRQESTYLILGKNTICKKAMPCRSRRDYPHFELCETTCDSVDAIKTILRRI